MDKMQYKPLGTTGMHVSRLCFGTMSFGGRADKTTSEAMYRLCRERGINFFDSANVYQHGLAEQYLGEFIQGERSEVIITTKGGSPMADDPTARGNSRKHLIQALDDSLKRLNTDYVDLYFLHHVDPYTPLEETMRTLSLFLSQGKVRALGVSNHAAWQIAKMQGFAALANLSPLHCIQPMYNIAKRQAEVEILPLAQEEGLGVISYSPLGGGLLSGRYAQEQAPSSGRLVENSIYQKRYAGPFYQRVATAFSLLSHQWDIPQVALAIAWVASNPAITSPIIGAANTTQLEGALASLEVSIDDEMKEAIDAISAPPPPATDRSEENYPLPLQNT